MEHTSVPRFVLSTEEERNKLVADAVPANTRKSTNTWLNAFNTHSPGIDWVNVSPAEFAKKLEAFYCDLRKQDGSPYKRASYIAARGALQRHLTLIGRTFNIYKDREFAMANAVLNGVLKDRKRRGEEGLVAHKEAVSEADTDKIADYFKDVATSRNAVLLAQYIWYILTLHFCLRGREIQAQLKKDDLVFETDENGDRVVMLSKDFSSKNHQGGLNGSAFASAGCIQDKFQVSVIERYLSLLHPSNMRLFQRSKNRRFEAPGDQQMYTNSPLSHNLLGKMMSSISEAANLSKKYTNHCVRATSITLLKAANVEDRKICAVSGHKSIESLSAYDRVTRKDSLSMAKALDTSTSLGEPASDSKAQCASIHSAGVSANSVSPASEPTVSSVASSACASPNGIVLRDCTNITVNVTNPSSTVLKPQKRKFPFSLKLKKKKMPEE